VMRGEPGVSPSRRSAVLQAVDELGYRPNAAAMHLAGRRTNIINVVLPDLRNPFFGDIVDGARPAAATHRQTTLLATGSRETLLEREAVETFLELRADALVMVSPLLDDEYLERIGRLVPTCIVGRTVVSDALDSVNSDERAGGRLVTEHLVAAGYGAVVHLDVAPRFTESASEARKAGYREAMSGAGLGEVSSSVRTGRGVGAVVAAELRAATTAPAFFAHNDLIALEAVTAIRRAGLAVGRDVGVVGYDDTYLASLDEFSLTSVNQSAAILGRRAVELVAERIGGRCAAVHEVIPPRLVVRASSMRGAASLRAATPIKGLDRMSGHR
jgi:LacI family transcriptional regulator